MGSQATITIHLTKQDLGLKEGLLRLRETRAPRSEFFRRSESEVAKMLLEAALAEALRRIDQAPESNK